jgi:hypothetical protein
MIQPIARTSWDERRKVVDQTLQRCSQWSVRRIAATLGVSRELVCSRRCKLIEWGRLKPERFVMGSDGKLYPVPCGLGAGKPRRVLRTASITLERIGRRLNRECWDAARAGDRARFAAAVKRIQDSMR